MLRPELTSEEMKKLRQVLVHSEPYFFIAATQDFKDAIMKDEHPIVNRLPKFFKETLLVGDGVRIDKIMVEKWLDGTLDPMNAFVLVNCEIRTEAQGGVIATGDSK